MVREESLKLASLLKWQMIGFIGLEILVALLVLAGLIPAFLPIKASDGSVIGINIGFLVMVALIVVIAASLWIAVLVEILGLLKFKGKLE